MTVADLSASPSLRDRKKAQSRRALQDAALRLAAEQGYAHLTVDAIAEAAGVSTRTFFNYFASKEDALFAPDPDAHARMAAEILAAPGDLPPLEVLRLVFRGSAARMGDRRPVWTARRRLLEDNPQLQPMATRGFAAFESAVAAALADRLNCDVRTEPYPALLASAATGAFRLACWYWQAAPDLDLTDVVDSFLDALAGGLAVRPTPLRSIR